MFFIEKIIDWEKRISNYSEMAKAKYRKGMSKFEEFKSFLADNVDWKIVIDNKKTNLFCE